MTDVSRMPRGGPNASCLDRALHADRRERLDRAGVDPAVRCGVAVALARLGDWSGDHQGFAHLALREVADVPDPRILELGAGHGELAAHLLTAHPTAHVTVTDLDDAAVATIRSGALGDHPRASVRTMDATAIDADDGAFHLAVFVRSLRDLPPERASRVLAEGTRVADELLIVDLPRPPAPLHLLRLAPMLPFAPFVPLVRDGVVTSLRSYGPSALRALADHAGVDAELRCGVLGPQVVIARRPREGAQARRA